MNVFMPDATVNERVIMLQENAAKIEQTTYQKPLTDDQLSTKREELADNCIKLNQFEDELKEVKEEYKFKMDPLKTLNKGLLTKIKTKQTSVTGNLYHMADYENDSMETYDSEGVLIHSRRLRPDEKQGLIFSFKKAQ